MVFVLMGGLFALFFDRLQKAMRRTDEALAESNAAKAKITLLYEKTLALDKLKISFLPPNQGATFCFTLPKMGGDVTRA